MNRVVHFEIGADNPERALDFYKKIFSWEIKKWEGSMDYWLIMTGEKDEPGIDGGMFQREAGAMASPSYQKAVNYICTVGVADIDKSMQQIKESGGEIIDDKSEIPTVGWFANARDTEGNIFGVMQSTGSEGM